ncbi:hypothetical protein M406DRAFT_71493 [Cryphonectria parasitica EP155]|uniref:Uncharacterized protein n=1 Tax=Cryphonectria parasitica (strain ATCC 38755 / EP155) TaxID=660469 RepID=A0A9P4Y8M1_CRYP1|nr:uncharacterized protein M406DRAFT_71493 [Cryphonectria parasitica EP155]KAF3768491.1 hypothetical protein M406DRAFT_71493 [Cryphonectria parasitica EP155]
MASDSVTPSSSLNATAAAAPAASRSSPTAWEYVKTVVPEYRTAPEFRGEEPTGIFERLGSLPAVNSLVPNPHRAILEREAGQVFDLGRTGGRSRFNINLKAILVQASGIASASPAEACDNCRNLRGLWQGCVRAPVSEPNALPHGACGNCAYNSHSRSCITGPVIGYTAPPVFHTAPPAPSVASQPAQSAAALSMPAPGPASNAVLAAAPVVSASADTAAVPPAVVEADAGPVAAADHTAADSSGRLLLGNSAGIEDEQPFLPFESVGSSDHGDNIQEPEGGWSPEADMGWSWEGDVVEEEAVDEAVGEIVEGIVDEAVAEEDAVEEEEVEVVEESAHPPQDPEGGSRKRKLPIHKLDGMG